MTQDGPATDSLAVAPLALFEATRLLLQLETAADARRVAGDLIRGLGGAVVAGGTPGVDVLAAAFDGLVTRFATIDTYDVRQLARTREDLVFIVQFLAAAIVASDESIFTEFTDWLQTLLGHRGVPPLAPISGLDALHPVIDTTDASAARLLRLGRQDLVDRLSA